MNSVMLDLESLGNGKNGVICQIGACYFDRVTGEIGKTFKVNVDITSVVRSGAEMDGRTVYWWLNQSEAARASILASPRLDVTDALNQLNDFLASATTIWSHATFDFVLLMETYKRLRIIPKFSYRAARDIRTLVDLAKTSVSKVPRTGLHHDALEDCHHQVKYCVEAFNTINKLRKLAPLLKEFLK